MITLSVLIMMLTPRVLTRSLRLVGFLWVCVHTIRHVLVDRCENSHYIVCSD